MKHRATLIAVAGLAAAFFAIVLNLAPASDSSAGNVLAVESLLAALIALGIGIVTLRNGGAWRFLAIAMIGPSVFVLADAGMRVLLHLKAG